ncbi:MAG: 50S ribosomal protein L11 methyltransferase [Ignavibacteriae bacterium]|nr:50S ribosomal protein L11 methyltransferase [Ignavibacteriota bacterium]
MLKKQFVNLHIAIPEEQFDLSYSALADFPFVGIEERMDEIVITFNAIDYTPEFAASLIERLRVYGIEAKILLEEVIDDKNWNAEWEESLEPVIVSTNVAISPTWKAAGVLQPIVILINPKMSFGTGYHPTTRMVCRMLEETVKPASRWIDAGTGTGVLAILAAKLGAEYCLAFDNDEWSVENSKENITLNRTDEQIECSQQDVFTVELPMSDGICANLYRNLLIPNFPKFYQTLKSPDGTLIVSGILKYDVDEIISEAEAVSFKHIHTELENEWAAIRFTKT